MEFYVKLYEKETEDEEFELRIMKEKTELQARDKFLPFLEHMKC